MYAVPKSLKIACYVSVSHAVNQSADNNDATVHYDTIVYSGVVGVGVLRSTPEYSGVLEYVLRRTRTPKRDRPFI
jgi:hypothetical protein